MIVVVLVGEVVDGQLDSHAISVQLTHRSISGNWSQHSTEPNDDNEIIRLMN